MSDFILTQTGEQLQNTLDNAATTSSVEAVANTAQTNSSDIDTIESKIPSEASSSNQLADKSHVESAVSSEETRAKAAEEANENAIDAIEQKIPSEATSSNQLADKAHVASAVSGEETRAMAAEQANANAIGTIEGKIPSEASSSNQLADKAHVANAVSAETSRAQLAEQANASDIDAIEGKIPSEASSSNQLADKAYVNSANTTLQGNISAEETRARAAEQANATDIDTIEGKIPSAATSSNQLADKEFVNSSVSTNTANYISDNGDPFLSLADLQAYSGVVTNNDYAFVKGTDSEGNTTYTRYKYNSSLAAWAKEYVLNNSGFTASQWATINSAITSGDKTKLDALPTRAQLDTLLAAKQNSLTFDTTPTDNSTNPVYSGGIKAALDGKQASLTFDNAPTANSGNPVKSGGVYAADATLQANIDSEASTRANADTTLQNNINSEASTRASADTTLQNNISSEASTRASADTTLQNNIDSEASTRSSADSTLQTNINSEATARTNADIALTRHTRLSSFSLTTLKSAVADQNLEKYGLKVGDYTTINGHTYVIAGLNCMKGSHGYTCTSNHVGLIVIPHTTQAWNASGNTYTGADDRGAGYKNSDLHYYLKNTVLPMVQTDLGSGNLYSHNKLLSSAVNTTGYNRFGTNSGCSSSWEWEDTYISALTEMQVYGGTIWSSSGFDTGEANQQLEVFQHFKHTEIFGGEYPWLRDVVSASIAADADNYGNADYSGASSARYVAALVLFH